MDWILVTQGERGDLEIESHNGVAEALDMGFEARDRPLGSCEPSLKI